MTNGSLAESYLLKATKRLRILPVLLDDEAYSDVVREAQEIVELALKGMLRQVGVEPPRWHDVGSILREHRGPAAGRRGGRGRSTWRPSPADLRKDRELSFYGDIDFIPTEHYSQEDAAARPRRCPTRRRRWQRRSSNRMTLEQVDVRPQPHRPSSSRPRLVA